MTAEPVSFGRCGAYEKSMRLLAILVSLLALGVPNAAVAQNAPPGNSEVEQYFESVPNGSGNAGVRRGVTEGRGHLPADVRRDLERLGADGRAVVDLAESNPASRQDGSAPAPRRLVPPDSAGGALEAIRGALGGTRDDGLGRMLPLLLFATVAAALAAVFLQRRREQ
jgi:hypothetical protein